MSLPTSAGGANVRVSPAPFAADDGESSSVVANTPLVATPHSAILRANTPTARHVSIPRGSVSGRGPRGPGGPDGDPHGEVLPPLKRSMSGAAMVDSLRTAQRRYSASRANAGATSRVMRVGDAAWLADKQVAFKSNRVRTTKYTVLSFLPKNMMEQFRKVANQYFLLISFLTYLPTSPKNFASLVGTFSAVLLVTAVKEAYEDYLRFKADNELNHRLTEVLDRGARDTLRSTRWQDVRVGDVVRVMQDQPLPADVVLISTARAETGTCFIDTCNLDGETNLKTRQALEPLKGLQGLAEVAALRCALEVELPQRDIYSFNGSLTPSAGAGEAPLGEKMALGAKNILLRGTVLRNTAHVFGIVTYTGHETKMLLNANDAPSKETNVNAIMNRCLYIIMAFQVVLCLVNTVFAFNMRGDGWMAAPIVAGDPSIEVEDTVMSSQLGLGDTKATFFFETFLTFVVNYSNLIPISLYVGIEVMKLAQKFLVDNDLAIYHARTDTRACSRTSNLIEEMGQVEFIFSDKTGTLTCNVMKFFCCSVGDVVYGMDGKAESAHEQGGYVRACSPHVEYDPSCHFVDRRCFDDMVSTSAANAAQLRDFWTLLAVCHTVVPSEKNGKIAYEAESPDEAALVDAARWMGFEFCRRSLGSVFVLNKNPPGGGPAVEEEYQVLNVNEFNSTRKRMSVALRCPDGRVRLFVKGADNVIMERLKGGKGGGRPGDASVGATNEHLTQFSEIGLRTLCCAVRELDEGTWQAWDATHKAAACAIDDRKAKLMAAAEAIEVDLTLLGATAIEDQLQDGVPSTIATLVDAGIRLWVLTGDKEETAINIGYSCRLLKKRMALFRLSRAKDADALLAKLSEALAKVDALDAERAQWEAAHRGAPNHEGHGTCGIVINGKALTFALQERVRGRFLELALRCDVCIACRVSPRQKAEVVKLVKDNLPVVTLAIGDGANDVSMIQAAHLGIGISGQEGMQAVRSSDYSIAQFRFLERLLLVHGRWGYNRITKFVLYYFYKNMLVTLTEYWFAWHSQFTGQIYFLDWLALAYNAVYTSYPCCFAFGMEQDVSAATSRRYPKLYAAGQEKEHFNAPLFTRWMLISLYHSAACYFVPLAFLSMPNPEGQSLGQWYGGMASFISVICVVTLKMCIETKYWTKYVVHVTWISTVVFFFTVWLLCTPSISKEFQPEALDLFPALAGDTVFWFALALTCVVALIPDVLLKFIQRTYYPRPIDIVREIEAAGRQKGGGAGGGGGGSTAKVEPMSS